jgi:hypothetical protein
MPDVSEMSGVQGDVGLMSTAIATRIPRLYCPIPSAIHVNAHEINADGLNWISKFNVFGGQSQWERYASANPGMLPARVMPLAPRGPALQAAANLLFWLWAFDDQECDETVAGHSAGDLVLQLCSLARTGEAPVGASSANPFIAALADLRCQLELVATAVQLARWSSSMQAYFLANTAVTIQNSRGVVPDLDTYVSLRIHSGAVKPTLMLLDVADGYELPASQLERPEIWALNEMVCTIVGWDNDLLSYHKEVLRGGADHNLVTVLQQDGGYSADQAVSQAVAMRDRVLCLFLRLHSQVAREADPGLRLYLSGLSSWIRGHLDWGMATARYCNPEDPADLPDGFADASYDDSYEPLLIPSISWWWGQLACTRQ